MTPTEARRDLAHGAVLFDPGLAADVAADWFDPLWWQARGALVSEPGGRGQVHYLHGGHGDWVLRQCRRGGFARHFSERLYWWAGERRTRAFAEWRLLADLHSRGLPVPRPVAAHYRRSAGGLFYEAALITCRLPARFTLRELYREGRVPEHAWAEVGRVVRRVHDAGVCHTDLNAGNLLLDEDAGVYVVDFDQGHRGARGRWREGNLARLHRSLQKTAVQAGRHRLEPALWQRLLDGYGPLR